MGQITSLPKASVSKIPNAKSIKNDPQKILFVGQKLAAGSAVSGSLVVNIASGGAENALFGEKSMLAAMVRAAKKINLETQMDAIPLDDAAGVNATGTIAFSGTASAARQLIVYIGSRKNHAYTIDITNGMTATLIGAALVAAITADTKAPVSGVNTTGSVVLTCAHKGTIGNFIGLQVYGSVAGVSITVTAMASGATNPTLTSIFNIVGDNRYQTVVFPSEYGFDFVTDNFLDGRFNADNAILSGQALCGKSDTYANLGSALTGENSPNLVVFCNQKVADTYYKGSASFELDFVIAAYFAAAKALRGTDGANLDDIISSSVGSRDREGGMHLASLPYFNTPMDFLPVMDTDRGFTNTEVAALKALGGSVMGNNTANNLVLVGEVVTAYKTDAQGNADTTWKYLNYVNTSENIAEYFFDNLKADYAQSRLTEGDLKARLSMANATSIAAKMVKYYKELSEMALVQAGEAALAFFKDNLSITLDMANGKVNMDAKVAIVTQVRQFVVPIKIAFSVN
jgi:phage tail sheath gpL-like